MSATSKQKVYEAAATPPHNDVADSESKAMSRGEPHVKTDAAAVAAASAASAATGKGRVDGASPGGGKLGLGLSVTAASSFDGSPPTVANGGRTPGGTVRRAGSARVENIGLFGNRTHHLVSIKFQLLRDAPRFQLAIICVILLAGIQVGIQTYNPTDPQLNAVMNAIDTAIMWIFIVEIIIKFIAEGKRPWKFFNDTWNVFDFAVVAVGLMPFGSNAVTALRLVRLLRVLKLVRALPKLRILVMGLLKSMSSIAYIGLLLLMLFYLYAVLGVSLFGPNDPVHMSTLHITFLTLFRCATLEDWTDVMYTGMYGCEFWGYGGREDACVASQGKPLTAVLYFASFVVLANMMILNLFIGVITGSMSEAKQTLEEELIKEKAEKEKMRKALMGIDDSEDENDDDGDEAITMSIMTLSDLVDEACDVVDEVTEKVLSGSTRDGSPTITSHDGTPRLGRRMRDSPGGSEAGGPPGELPGSGSASQSGSQRKLVDLLNAGDGARAHGIEVLGPVNVRAGGVDMSVPAPEARSARGNRRGSRSSGSGGVGGGASDSESKEPRRRSQGLQGLIQAAEAESPVKNGRRPGPLGRLTAESDAGGSAKPQSPKTSAFIANVEASGDTGSEGEDVPLVHPHSVVG